ncbi:MAG: hypothetical protein V1703_04490 [Candidatus Altiarchaeota archaeon]
MDGKGQSALEYMMTYGWAILVILILAVVLWQMGILDIGESTTPGKRGFSQITPLDWKCSTDGTLSVTITNEAGVITNITGATATIVSGGTGDCQSVSGVPISVFRPAQSSEIVFSDCSITDTTGDYFRAEVGISYINPSSGIEHLSYGKIWGPLE